MPTSLRAGPRNLYNIQAVKTSFVVVVVVESVVKI